jgi:hypothetical protein
MNIGLTENHSLRSGIGTGLPPNELAFTDLPGRSEIPSAFSNSGMSLKICGWVLLSVESSDCAGDV